MSYVCGWFMLIGIIAMGATVSISIYVYSGNG